MSKPILAYSDHSEFAAWLLSVGRIEDLLEVDRRVAEAEQRRIEDQRLRNVGYHGLRSRYVEGCLSAEEFDSRLDRLLALDPAALDRPAPNPVDVILRSVYANR